MKHKEVLSKEAFRNKFKDFQFHLNLLKRSYDFSLESAVAYKKADADRQKEIRQAFSVTEDHIVKQFPESIMKEAYVILTNAPYRKNLLMLYQSNIYDKYADADTVESTAAPTGFLDMERAGAILLGNPRYRSRRCVVSVHEVAGAGILSR